MLNYLRNNSVGQDDRIEPFLAYVDEKKVASGFWNRCLSCYDEHKGGRILRLSQESKIPYKTITNQIYDQRMPKVMHLINISRATHLSLDFLIFGEESGPIGILGEKVMEKMRKDSAFRVLVEILKGQTQVVINDILKLIHDLKQAEKPANNLKKK